MMGEHSAEVLDVNDVSLHGLAFRDVTLRFADGAVDRARLGPEGVPDDLRAGDHVLATRIANVVISLRRSDP